MQQLIDDGAGLAGEVSADAPRKRVFRGVAWLRDAKPTHPGAAGGAVGQTGPKPCRGRPVGLYGELKSEGQNGNSGL